MRITWKSKLFAWALLPLFIVFLNARVLKADDGGVTDVATDLPTLTPTQIPDTATFTPEPDTATFTPEPDTATYTPEPDTATFTPDPDTPTFSPTPDDSTPTPTVVSTPNESAQGVFSVDGLGNCPNTGDVPSVAAIIGPLLPSNSTNWCISYAGGAIFYGGNVDSDGDPVQLWGTRLQIWKGIDASGSNLSFIGYIGDGSWNQLNSSGYYSIDIAEAAGKKASSLSLGIAGPTYIFVVVDDSPGVCGDNCGTESFDVESGDCPPPPTDSPTGTPTQTPSNTPTQEPTDVPTNTPTETPTVSVTATPCNLTVSGVVQNSSGTPIPGAEVELLVSGNSSETGFASATTGQDGSYGMSGTITDTSLQYTVEVLCSGYEDYCASLQIADCTPILNYSIILTSTEQSNQQNSCKVPDPVNTGTGQFFLDVTDLSVPGKAGLDFTFTRKYLGELVPETGPLGVGWSHNWDVYLVPQGQDMVVHFSDGKYHLLHSDGEGGYSANNGFFYTLSQAQGLWQMKGSDGTTYAFDGNYNLSSVTDHFGNAITLAYQNGLLSQITDTTGQAYDFDSDTTTGLITALHYPDPNGGGVQTLSYAYDEELLVGASGPGAGPDGYQASYDYDPSTMLMTMKKEPRSPKSYKNVRYTYDAQGRFTAIYRQSNYGGDAAGTACTQIAYGTNNDGSKQVGITQDGYSSTLQYTSGNSWSGTVVGGVAAPRHWDPNNQGLADVADMRGNVTRYTYYTGNQGLVHTSTDPTGVVTTYQYDSYGFGIVINKQTNDPNTGQSEYESNTVDNQGHITQSQVTASNGGTSTITYSYDPSGFGQWTRMTDTDGHQFERDFDANGRLIKYKDLTDDLETDTTYDSLSRVKTTTNLATGLVTTYTYDLAGNLVKTEYSGDGADSSTQAAYDDNGNRLWSEDAKGNKTTYTYSTDGTENLLSETGPILSQTGQAAYTRTYIYDPSTNQLQSTITTGSDGRGGTYSQAHTYTYVQTGCGCAYPGKLQTDTVTNATVNGQPGISLTTHYTYDADGNYNQVTDPKGNIAQYVYDVNDRLSSLTTGYGTSTARTIAYQYDGFGNRTKLTDGKSQATSFSFNGLNQLAAEAPPSGPSITYGYDGEGRLNAKHDRDNRAWAASFDGQGRMNSESFLDGSGSNIGYSYAQGGIGDSTDQTKSVTGPFGQTGFKYGHMGRLAAQSNPAPSRNLTMNYDLNGNALSLAWAYGQSTTTETFAYDEANQETKLIDWHGNQFNYYHDAAGHMTKVEYNAVQPNGSQKLLATGTFDYDGAGQQLDAIYTQAGTGQLYAKVSYAYDAAGNRTSRNTLATQASYGYDPLNQLVADSNTADIRGNIAFAYDVAGNRVSQSFAGNGAIAYSDNNSLNRIVGQSGTSEGTITYQYDAEGNVIQKVVTGASSNNGTTLYTWDGKNRLTQAAFTSTDDASQSYTIAYGYDYTNHRVSRTLTKNGTTETRGYLYYGNQLIEETKNGSTLAMYGWDQQGLISRTDANGNSLFYLWDGLGNCIGIIDQDGRLAQSYEYSAFGECLSGKDAVNAYRFVGRFGGMQDDETGLTYFWNRWYDSKTGRWMSEDPVRQGGGVNLYGYAMNCPATLLDKNGLELSFDEATNILYNEMGSYSGDGIETAYWHIASALWNGDEKYGDKKRPKTAPTTAPNLGSKGEKDVWQAMYGKVAEAKSSRFGDACKGPFHFGFGIMEIASQNGDPVVSRDGPFYNSYSTPQEPSSGAWAFTFK